ncbi:putative glycosyl hydrolase family 10 protein [Neofusicoccum parvum]|nr:putative glycosyl hydrolase family 10 protein [Neofusicoccum parvum]
MLSHLIVLVIFLEPILAVVASTPTIAGLNDLAVKAGLMYFGTAVDNASLNESDYVAIVNNTHEWGQITAANGLKPEWLSSKTWTRDELLSVLENHIKNVVTHYEGRCYAWDVVNEAFYNNGTWRPSIWYDTIGPEYVAFAFKTARKYTTAKLYYNDNNTTDINPHTDSVHAMIKQLRADGVPIDGVGIQAHLIIDDAREYPAPDFTAIFQNLRYFASIPDLEIAITELDVRIELPNDETKIEQQAVIYADVVSACQKVKACVGITVWDFWDKVSWVPSARPGFGDAQLFWTNLTRKPAYYRIADVLSNAAE